MDPYIRDFDFKIHETLSVNSFIDLTRYYDLSHHLNILHINIRSIDKNIDELKLHRKSLDYDFHVIALTETFRVSDPMIFGIYMDPYIRDFDFKIHETLSVDSFIDLTRNYDLSHHLNILHINIRSIDKNIDELKLHRKSLDYDFHVIALTETFQVSDPMIFGISGYSTLYNEGKYNKNEWHIIFRMKI
ncbi:hypothetical protein HHI36_015451 [Cryptolaemus montrouzieri]|uniref:Uncharacterized protein n=1 Tax=Cryptolaemus montrouzieri TaxID=559131 RepID=A0ABD2N6G5_9CUCU